MRVRRCKRYGPGTYASAYLYDVRCEMQVPDISGAAPPSAMGGVMTGQDVISEGLITFSSIQELISINTKLQVISQLST